MTAVLAPDASPLTAGESGEAAVERGARVRAWFRLHRTSLVVLSRVLLAVGAATAWNLQGWPGRVDDDEGTYVAEAWAMIYQHHLSHYTYWYDHPPLGWAQLAAYIWLTDGIRRYPSTVMVGREFMLLLTLVSCVLLYILCRRLAFRRTTAAVTVLLFGLSPLAIYYHRMVSLDNIGMVWLLAALVIATSRRGNLGAAFWSAVCMAAAVLSKETLALLLPVVLTMIWQRAQTRTRKWHMGVFTATFVELVAAYPLFATLRGELIPGRGHVSLTWAVWWQLFSRPGTGSLLDSHSATHSLAVLWLGVDPWLVVTGFVLVPAGLVFKRLRPFAFGMLIQVAILVPGGYVPYFSVTAMLPFAALLAGGVADTLWTPGVWWRRGPAWFRVTGWLRTTPVHRRVRMLRKHARYYRTAWACRSAWVHTVAWFRGNPWLQGNAWLLRYAGRVPVAAAAIVAAVLVAPQWGTALVNQAKVDGDAGSLAATAWVEQHVPRHDVVVVDDYMWLDLKLAGMNPVWSQKTDTDPQTAQTQLRHGWRSIQYIVLSGQVSAALGTLPTLQAAIAHSVVVKSFADGVTVRRVIAG